MADNASDREGVEMALRQDEDVKTLNRKQILAILDERARRYLGMTGKQFLQALEKGELPDSPAVAHLAMLAGEGR